MNGMCRLCLSIPSENMCTLSDECDIIRKIKECLSIEILLNKSLPSKICSICVNKIEDIHNYQKKVQDNQEVLLKLVIDNGFEINKSDENNFLINTDTNITENECDASIPCERESVKDMYSSSDEEVLSKLKIDDKKQLYKNEIKLLPPKKRKREKLEKNKQKLKKLQHKCLMCFIDCKTKNDLLQHYNKHEEITTKDNKTLTPGSDTIKKYRTNISEDGKINYECLTCCQSYNENQDILKHVKGHQRPFICKLCGRTYKTVYEIVRHGRAHNGMISHCSFGCGFSTVYKGALKIHEKRHGTQKFKFTCEKCGKGFDVKTWYDQHQNVHSGLKPFACDICGVSFHIDRYLTAHRSKVHPQTSLIKKHLCVVCSLPCDTRNSLKRHMEEHGVKSVLLCDVCGKVFTNSDLLKNHKNSHLGIKPYTCRYTRANERTRVRTVGRASRRPARCGGTNEGIIINCCCKKWLQIQVN